MPRLIALRALLLIVVVIFVGRLAQLQLVDTEARRYGNDPAVNSRRYLTVQPRRGEILAADRRTLLAESVPIYSIAVVPGSLPSRVTERERRDQVLARLAQIAGLNSTLTISPSTALDTAPGLRAQLRELSPLPALQPTQPLTITVAPADALRAFEVSRAYSDVVTISNLLEEQIARDQVRRYETILVQEDISPELALVIRENSNYLPGVQVIEGFRRRYPQSTAIPSLSHLIGYSGRISQCELVAENPATSWLTSLSDVVRNAGACGLIPKRIDPQSIGLPVYQGSDRIGKTGLEAYYEAELRGSSGIDWLLVDALERPVSAPTTLRPVEHGHNLILTIDVAFQAEVERILTRWIAEGERRRQTSPDAHKRAYDPITSGVIVALDPRDGRVLAMVSLPDYDNNVWVDPSRSAELQALLAPADPEAQAELLRLAPLTNRAISGLYPAGSSLKPFVGAVALQNNVIAPDTRVRDPGLIRLIERSGAEFILPNSVRNRDNGEINVVDALRLSSNVFFATIAGGNTEVTNLDDRAFRTAGLNIDRLVEGLEWFGLGRRTGIDLVGEANGLVPTQTWKFQTLREPWTTGDTYNTAIGQGYLQVTPLQLAVATGGIALDGTVYRPHLVQAITDANGTVVRTIAPELLARAPVEPAYLAAMRQGMWESVVNGLNVAAREECSGLRIAGKTGTAEFGPIIITSDGRQVRQSHGWFVGFAPYENPEIVVAVLVEGVGDLNDGSSTIAVPALTQVMQAYFGVTPPEDAPRTCPVLPTE
jgi:penicillin-binding protein 2